MNSKDNDVSFAKTSYPQFSFSACKKNNRRKSSRISWACFLPLIPMFWLLLLEDTCLLSGLLSCAWHMLQSLCKPLWDGRCEHTVYLQFYQAQHYSNHFFVIISFVTSFMCFWVVLCHTSPGVCVERRNWILLLFFGGGIRPRTLNKSWFKTDPNLAQYSTFYPGPVGGFDPDWFITIGVPAFPGEFSVHNSG